MVNRLQRRQVRSIAGSTLTTTYQNLGAVVTITAYKLIINNATTTDVNIIDQTTNDAFYVAAGTTFVINEGLSGSGQQEDKMAVVPANTQYQAKLPSGAAGTGTLIITVLG